MKTKRTTKRAKPRATKANSRKNLASPTRSNGCPSSALPNLRGWNKSRSNVLMSDGSGTAAPRYEYATSRGINLAITPFADREGVLIGYHLSAGRVPGYPNGTIIGADGEPGYSYGHWVRSPQEALARAGVFMRRLGERPTLQNATSSQMWTVLRTYGEGLPYSIGIRWRGNVLADSRYGDPVIVARAAGLLGGTPITLSEKRSTLDAVVRRLNIEEKRVAMGMRSDAVGSTVSTMRFDVPRTSTMGHTHAGHDVLVSPQRDDRMAHLRERPMLPNPQAMQTYFAKRAPHGGYAVYNRWSPWSAPRHVEDAKTRSQAEATARRYNALSSRAYSEDALSISSVNIDPQRLRRADFVDAARHEDRMAHLRERPMLPNSAHISGNGPYIPRSATVIHPDPRAARRVMPQAEIDRRVAAMEARMAGRPAPMPPPFQFGPGTSRY